ncbi:hypothetical protein AN476_07145 [Phaeobacter sp. 11ANDIMAR09]|nr:hypothetical protein AN476_07145 [Phaeobacter sp. 11ANDIMAR09]
MNAMAELTLGILTGAPIGVWPLLALLIALGLLCSRDRQISLLSQIPVPLIALINLPSLLALEAYRLAFISWGLAYLCGILGGFWKQGHWTLARTGLRVMAAGEWFSLTALMLLFWANFANGLVASLFPELAAMASFQILYLALLGVLSGSFLGRLLRMFFWQNQPTPHACGKKRHTEVLRRL